MHDVFIARQPIFDLNKEVVAYEILYRNSEHNAFDNTDCTVATASTLLNSFLNIGLENLTDSKPAFINFDESFIIDEIPLLFPSESLVIEILETVEPSDIILEKCKALHQIGYTIALDDFIFDPRYEPLLDFVDIIKLDFMSMSKIEIRSIMTKYSDKRHIRYLAEKIESFDDFEDAARLGCTLFQGYYFGRPVMQKTQGMISLNGVYISLMSAINQKEPDFDEVSKLIMRDMSLTYFLLKLANSPGFGMIIRIKSIRQALVVLGAKELRKWISLVLLNSFGKDKPSELVRLSLLRGRMAEQIALKTELKSSSESLFLAGLFSMLDAILDRPFGQIVEEISLPHDVKEYLVGAGSSIDQVMALVIAYEKGDWDTVSGISSRLNLDQSNLISIYMDTLKWQHDLQLI